MAALRWTPEERQMHITAREALASSYGTTFLVPRLEAQGKKVGSITLHSDSTPTVWAWRNGSGKPTISKAARQATSYLASRGIFFQAKHIAGIDNKRADFLSRAPDPEDYCLRREVFRRACAHFGVRPTMDLFANRYNRQVRKFFTMREDPMAAGVNALRQEWPRGPLYANPPWSLITEFLAKVSEEQATVLTVLPCWQAQAWWTEFRRLWVAPPLYLKGELFHCPQGRPLPPPRWKVAIVLLKGQTPPS